MLFLFLFVRLFDRKKKKKAKEIYLSFVFSSFLAFLAFLELFQNKNASNDNKQKKKKKKKKYELTDTHGVMSILGLDFFTNATAVLLLLLFENLIYASETRCR